MREENAQLRVLIGVAAVLCAIIIGYNAFFVPDVALPSALFSDAAAKKVDINTAAEDELGTLTGVGPMLAKRIVEYRRENGPFKAVEELLNVEGIGEKTLDALLEEIILEEG